MRCCTSAADVAGGDSGRNTIRLAAELVADETLVACDADDCSPMSTGQGLAEDSKNKFFIDFDVHQFTDFNLPMNHKEPD